MRRLGIAICSMCAGIFCCAVHAGSGTAGPAGDANFWIARLEQYLDGVSRVRTSGEAYSGVFFASDGESAAKLGLSKTTARPVDDVMRKWLDSHEVTASESEFSTISWGGLRRTEVSIYWRPDGDETREIIDFGVYLRSGAGLFEWHPVQRGERGVVTEVLSNPRMAIFVPPFNGPQAGALVNPVPPVVFDVLERTRRKPATMSNGFSYEDPDELLLRQAAFAGHRESFPLADGILLGYISNSVPFRLDTLMRLCRDVRVSLTTATGADVAYLVDPQDEVIVLTGVSALGQIEVVLLPEVGAMPIAVRIRALANDISGWKPVGRQLAGDFANLGADPNSDTVASSVMIEVVVTDTQAVGSIHVPMRGRITGVTRMTSGASVMHLAFVNRSKLEVLQEHPPGLVPAFPELMRIGRTAGGPGLPEEWRDGAVRLALDPEAVAAVDKAVTDVQALPRSDGRWQVLWPLGFLLLLMSVPVAIIIYGRWHAR